MMWRQNLHCIWRQASQTAGPLDAGGERILTVFESRLPAGIRALNFGPLLRPENVDRVVNEADGYQPHLVAPEMGYRRLLQECLAMFKAC